MKTAITGLLALTLAAQLPPPATTVHGQRLNETSEEFAATLQDMKTKVSLNCQGKIDRKYKSISKQLTEARSGKRVKIITDAEIEKGAVGPGPGWSWIFDHDHLVQASFTDSRDQSYNLFLDQAIQKWGKYTDHGVTEYQNGYGARFEMRHAIWFEPDGSIISLGEVPSGEFSITILTVETKEEAEAMENVLEKISPSPKL
jgi:hypothetical protein